jgi:putative membrane-bound dehydrogenase-like protein
MAIASRLTERVRLIIVYAIAAILCASACSALKHNDADLASVIQAPPGFTVEQIAGPDKVQYPMMAVLDDRGRLFVTESSGKNIKGADMPKQPECRISVLEDTDGDGVYDQSKVFADKLSLPMGALWYRGSLYVASPPDFIRLDDADDDGVSEKREVILTGWNIRNTASLHGPFMGPDGWLYLTHGRHGYKIQTKEGATLEGQAARIWRCRPDGTGLERVAGGGFDNPVELAFTTAGEMIGTMTYFVDPQNGQRDALMHFVEGGVYPKPHPVVSEFKRTGELMPVMTKFARIAPSGLMQYHSAVFGAAFQGNLFSAQFNPHRIQRHVLHREGATFRTDDADFITSTDPDFHPTDVLEDADGSLIFLDTGGWYVDACPLSKYHKPERRGAVYRIRKTGAPHFDDPRGVKLQLDKLPPAELAKHLEDTRPAVRERSLELLVAVGEPATGALAKLREQATAAEARAAAVFGLGRIATPTAQQAVRAALTDADAQVRTAAAHMAGMAKDRAAVDQLSHIIKSDELPVRRAAATALGQIGEARAASALLAAADVQDRFIEHAIIHALQQLKNTPALLAALKQPQPRIRKAALITLDQIDGSPLRRQQVIPILEADDAELRRAALWVVSHHADWAGDVVNLLRARLSAPRFAADEAEPLRQVLLAFAADAQVQTMVAQLLDDLKLAVERHLFLLDTIDRCALKKLPAVWVNSFAKHLKGLDAGLRTRTVQVIRARRVADLDNELKGIVADNNEPITLRIAALSTLVPREPKLTTPSFELLLRMLEAENEASLRLSAAQTIGQAELDDQQLLLLANRFITQSDALTLSPLLDAFRATKNDQVGQALAATLNQPAVNLEAIGGKRIEQMFQPFSAQTRAAARQLSARFEAEAEARIRRLKELEPLLTAGGDVGNGRRIFFGNKVACAKCHTIGSEGGDVGPDLTAVGSIRSGHDILEAIVFPSASFVPGRETRIVTTKTNGKVYTGVISEHEGGEANAIVLIAGPDDKVRIPREEVASIKSSVVSLMPDGIVAGLSQKELTDLLAFLKAQK